MRNPSMHVAVRGVIRLLVLLVVGAVIAVALPISIAPAEGQPFPADTLSGTRATDAEESPGGAASEVPATSPLTAVPARTAVATPRSATSPERPLGTATIDPDALTFSARGGSSVIRARVTAPAQGGRLGVVSLVREREVGEIVGAVSATVNGSPVRASALTQVWATPRTDVISVDGQGRVVADGDQLEIVYPTGDAGSDSEWLVDTGGRFSAFDPPPVTVQTPSAEGAEDPGVDAGVAADTAPGVQAEEPETDASDVGLAAIAPMAIVDTGVTASNQIPYTVNSVDVRSSPRSFTVTSDRFAALTTIEIGDDNATRASQLTSSQSGVKVSINGVQIPAGSWSYTYEIKTVNQLSVRYKGIITFDTAITLSQFDRITVTMTGGSTNAAGWFLNLKGQLQPTPGTPGDPLPPAPCTPAGASVWVAAADSNRTSNQLYRQEQGQSGFAPVGPRTPWVYNSVGYNTNDNYLYAVSQRQGTSGNTSYPAGHLLQINPNTGVVNNLGRLTRSNGTAYAPALITTGFFDQDNTFWVADSNNDPVFYRVNLTTRVVTNGPSGAIGLDHAMLGAAPGFAWSLSGEGNSVWLYRMNMGTGTRVRFDVTNLRSPGNQGFPAPSTSAAYGTAWTYGNGNLGFGSNGSPQSFQIRVTNPTATTPTFELVSVTPAPTSNSNDAASNAVGSTFNTDLAVTKTRTETAGNRASWDITVENVGPCGTSGFTVVDRVPGGANGFSNVRVDSAVGALTGGAVVNGTTAQINFGPMDAGERRVIRISAQVPPASAGCVENPVTVTGNERDPVPANNSASDNWCRLVVIKSVVDVNQDGRIDSQDTYQSADGGKHKVTYEVTVRNPSSAGTASYTLTDTPLFATLVTVTGARVTSDRANYGTQNYTGVGPFNLSRTTTTIPSGATHTYTVEVIYSGPTTNPAVSPIAECVSGTERRGLFNRAVLQTGSITSEATACAALSRPQDVTLVLRKQAANGSDAPLPGAGFAVHDVAGDDSVGPKIKDLGELDGGFYSAVLTPGRAYYLLETRSPTGYQLLSQPVLIYVDRDPGGNATLEIYDESSDVAARVSESATNPDTVVLRVADVRIGAMPLTGSAGFGPYVRVGVGVILLGLLASVLLRRSRRTS